MPAPIPVTYSTPATDALAAMLAAHYDLGGIAAVRLLHRGLNDSYRVETEGGRYVLRLYRRGWRSPGEIAYELDLLEHLGRKGTAVSLPVRRKDGAATTAIPAPEGPRAAVLFTHAPGRELADTVEDSRRYGGAAAAIHAASDDFASAHPRLTLDLRHLLDEPMAAMRPFLGHRGADLDYLETLAARLREEVLRLPALDRGFCHGDLHGDNAHIKGDRVTFFDFDCCGPGWRAYDIAVFRWRWGDDEKGEALWAAFLEGYRVRRGIGEADLAAVPLFVAARAIWLRGLHAANTADWGMSWLNDAYWDRLLKGLREWQARRLGGCGGAADPIIPAEAAGTQGTDIAAAAVAADAPALQRPKL